MVDGQAIHLLDLASNKQRELVPASFNPSRHEVHLAFAPDSAIWRSLSAPMRQSRRSR